MNQQEWHNKLQKIGQELTDRYPGYAEYLEECGSPEKADQMLTAQGMIAENELLQFYCRTLGLEPEEEELKVPERFPQISAKEYVSTAFLAGCITYTGIPRIFAASSFS